ncbi:MAG: hypothetical protein FWC33_05800 [Candidatus Bathyarchaeota archaeon]|nr:hypothetical protein [Candidatus Termiticorpusculum sp.]
MTICPSKVQMSSKKFSVQYVLVFIILVGAFSLTIYFGALFIPNSSESSKPSENYAVLTLALYQSTTYVQGDAVYEFSYVSSGQRNLLLVASDGQSESYMAVPGTSLNPFDLKITIYSANEKMIVLHVIQVS